ncbi:DUF3052 domain-containing protein [Microbacterium halophytorum]|uniref:DUF3052 domain-containing protein n=1 Tax=Microbacterium halophytorum TaxID=2067568 RepID=UPI000CFCDD11|nr:DUF3052 domain-containing protein [Microbacterium halophytorum]
MARTVAEKLQIKPNEELLFEGTDDQLALLAPLPEGVSVVRGIERDTSDTAFAFAADRARLDELLASNLPALTSFRAAWIGYPKGGRSDINRDRIWERVEEEGWTLTANIAISEEWSSVRLKRA